MDSTSPVRNYVKDRIENVHTGFLAVIVEYFPDTLTATIQPLLRRRRLGLTNDYPQLTDVPIVTPLGARNFIKPVYANGDLVYCVVADASISESLAKRYGLDSVLSHQIDNTLIVGGVGGNDYQPQTGADQDGMVLGGDNSYIAFTSDGVTIKNGESEVVVGANGVSIKRGDNEVRVVPQGISIMRGPGSSDERIDISEGRVSIVQESNVAISLTSSGVELEGGHGTVHARGAAGVPATTIDNHCFSYSRSPNP